MIVWITVSCKLRSKFISYSKPHSVPQNFLAGKAIYISLFLCPLKTGVFWQTWKHEWTSCCGTVWHCSGIPLSEFSYRGRGRLGQYLSLLITEPCHQKYGLGGGGDSRWRGGGQCVMVPQNTDCWQCGWKKKLWMIINCSFSACRSMPSWGSWFISPREFMKAFIFLSSSSPDRKDLVGTSSVATPSTLSQLFAKSIL